MKFRTAFALSLAGLMLAIAFSALLPPLPAWQALAAQVRTYGRDGRDGINGRDGRDGRDGDQQSIFIDGAPRRVSTIGALGRDGEEGGDADRPTCSAQPHDVRYDLQAPDGGDGGDGGEGGRGGQGGAVTLYYTDPTQLRQVFVNAAGGDAGRGGRGGRGSGGCRCDDRSWRVEVCQDGNCHEERYDCRDGDSGRYGRDGRDGATGAPGQVWLIDQVELLPPERPTLTEPLSTWLSQPATLSKHRWEARSGIGALLASGSVVADTYNQYLGQVEAQVQLLWQAPRSPTQFLGLSPTATLADSGDVQIQFPDRYWIDGRFDRNSATTTYTIDQIVRADRVTDLAWGTPSGSGQDWTLTVIDLGRESAAVTTRFELVYRTTDDDPRSRRRARYQERFAGVLPPPVVTQDQNRFVLALGQLDIRDRDLRQGTFAQVELRIQRSLGEHSAEQRLTWTGQL